MDLEDKIEIPGFLLPFMYQGVYAYTKGFKPMQIRLAVAMQETAYHAGPWYVDTETYQAQFPDIDIKRIRLYEHSEHAPRGSELIAGGGGCGFIFVVPEKNNLISNQQDRT